MLSDSAACKRVADIVLCPMFAGWGYRARGLGEAPRGERDVGGDTNVSHSDAISDPVIGRIGRGIDDHHLHVGQAGRADRARAIGYHEHRQTEARRHAIGFLADRAGIGVDVNSGHWSLLALQWKLY